MKSASFAADILSHITKTQLILHLKGQQYTINAVYTANGKIFFHACDIVGMLIHNGVNTQSKETIIAGSKHFNRLAKHHPLLSHNEQYLEEHLQVILSHRFLALPSCS